MKYRLIAVLAVSISMITTATAQSDALPKYGLYLHFGLPTFGGKGDGRDPLDIYTPTDLDVRSWVHTAKLAGASFAILTVKHESGFCLWPAADYDYSVANSPVKTDVLAEFLAACNTEGITPGIHYSIPDARNEDGNIRYQGSVSDSYFELIKRQITELHTTYPGIRLQNFNRSSRLTPDQYHELCQIVEQLNPQCQLIVQDNQGATIDPAEASNSWFYHPESVNSGWMWSPNARLQSASFLYQKYTSAIQNGRPFVVGVGIDNTGHIPQEYVAELMEIKKLIDGSSSNPTVPPAIQSNETAPATSADNTTSKLKALKQQYDQGLITREVYDQKVKEVLDGM
jgi:hypothetical protein